MGNKKLAPVCLFTYNRLEATKQTIEALKANYLAPESKLIIFSDGAKNEDGKQQVDAVRDYLKTIDGFQEIEIFESSENKGLAASIISGVTKVIDEYGEAIVLEDDLVTTPNFLDFMNQNLDFYQYNERIISICGYGLKINKPHGYQSDIYLYGRSSSWGWATWKDRWLSIDWDVRDWQIFKNDKKAIRDFNRNGSDMFKMLRSVTEGQGNSWAIRFGYTQYKQHKYSVTPFKSLVNNIGFAEEGTNTKFKYSRFKIDKDSGTKRVFLVDKNIQVNGQIEKACYHYHSIPIRIYSKIRYILGF